MDRIKPEVPKESSVPLAPNTTVVIEGCSEPVTISTLEEAIAPTQPLRRGKWTREEEEYADHLIQEFQKGIINIKESTTMRSYLAQELHCPAMRISKKYHGNASMGLQMYTMLPVSKRSLPETAVLIERMKGRRQYFRMQFLIKLYQMSLKNRPIREKPDAPVHHFAVLSAAPGLLPAHVTQPQTLPGVPSASRALHITAPAPAVAGARVQTRSATSPTPAVTSTPVSQGMMPGMHTPFGMPFAMNSGSAFVPAGGTGTPMYNPCMKVEPMAFSAPGMPAYADPRALPVSAGMMMAPDGSSTPSSTVVYMPVMSGDGQTMQQMPVCLPPGFSFGGMPQMMPMGGDYSGGHAMLCAQAARPVQFSGQQQPGSGNVTPHAFSMMPSPVPLAVHTSMPTSAPMRTVPTFETSYLGMPQPAVSAPLVPSSKGPATSLSALSDASLLLTMSTVTSHV